MSRQLSNDREALSSFMDGELDAAAGDSVVHGCKGDTELRQCWAVYHCIGDVLRSADTGGHSERLAASVSARLASEPHLMSPRPARQAVFTPRRAASLVAAVAGIAAVSWVALPRLGGLPEQVARPSGNNTPMVVRQAVQPAPSTVPPTVSREYLAAHRQYSGSLAMQGFATQIHSVALESDR